MNPRSRCAAGGERYRNERRAFGDHVGGPRESRHARGHVVRRRRATRAYLSAWTMAPAVVPEPSRPTAPRARKAGAARTTRSASRVERMAATLALRRRQFVDACPAAAADEAVVAAIEQPRAGNARTRQEQLSERVGGARQRRAPQCGRDQGRGAHTASHIASRGASRPNHRSNASAPCSTSIARPSAARSPRARHRVDPPCVADTVYEVDDADGVGQATDVDGDIVVGHADGRRVHHDRALAHGVARRDGRCDRPPRTGRPTRRRARPCDCRRVARAPGHRSTAASTAAAAPPAPNTATRAR